MGKNKCFFLIKYIMFLHYERIINISICHPLNNTTNECICIEMGTINILKIN